MPNLDKRIAELEKVAPTGNVIKAIVIRCLTPGVASDEIQELHDKMGLQRWTRQPGEPEQVFVDRVTQEATHNGRDFVVLFDGPIREVLDTYCSGPVKS